MLEMTASQAIRLAGGGLDALDRAVLDDRSRSTSTVRSGGRRRGPRRELRQRLPRTARVPPIGYQTPSVGLHVRDRAEHRRRAIGRGADILAEMVEHLRQAGVRHMAADRPAPPSCPCAAPSRRAGCGVECLLACPWCRQIPRPTSRRRSGPRPRAAARSEVLEAAVAVARRRAGGEAVHARRHGVDVLDQVDAPCRRRRSSAIADRAGRGRGPRRMVAPGLREDAAQHARHRQDRRPHVEAETWLLPGCSGRAGSAPPPCRRARGFLSSSVTRWPRAAASRPPPGRRGRHPHHHMRGHGRLLLFLSQRARLQRRRQLVHGAAPPARPQAEVLGQQPRGDPRALVDHRQPAARMRPPPTR